MEDANEEPSPCGSEKITKCAKFRKKWMRAKAKLSNEGFNCSKPPTSFIVLANAGLANGVRRTELQELLKHFKTLSMPPNKSYALVSFESVKSAENCMEKLQGYILKSSMNLASPSITLYLHYIEHFQPKMNMESPNTFEYRPEGLILLEDFITIEKENELLLFLERENPSLKSEKISSNNLKHRQVWHYGYEFRYEYSDVDPEKPLPEGIPSLLKSIISKLMKTRHVKCEPNQITINKYEPGQGIPPHIDNTSAFGDGLTSLSLRSQTVMDFKRVKDGRHTQVLLKPRSLIIFTGESRYKWTHGICPRKVDLIKVENSNDDSNSVLTPVNRGTRYSITFRKVKEDYRGPNVNNMSAPSVVYPVNESQAEILEELHVHNVYNEIAPHFTSTRDKPWPKVKKFIEDLEPHSIILDVGCGSGRYLGVRKDVYMAGCDRSESLIGICKEKGFEVFTCDGLSLPVRPGLFDACICIAVIHHYSTYDRRRKAIEQILTSVKTNGKILISVWALEQEYKRIKSKYLKNLDDGKNLSADVTDHCKLDETKIDSTENVQEIIETTRTEDEEVSNNLPVHKNRTPFQQQDVLVPWHRKNVTTPKRDKVKAGKLKIKPSDNDCLNDNGQDKIEKASSELSNDIPRTFHRYYHVFKKGELNELCESFSNVKVLDSYYDEGNWCVILQKM